MNSFSAYQQQIEKALAAGNATEHTHRPALKTLIESLASGVMATNEPKRVQCGAPDFIVTRGSVPLGYVEAKDVGKSLDEAEASDQLKRYRASLGNLVLTDYLEFRWYVGGKHRLTARLAGRVGAKGKLKAEKDGSLLIELCGFYIAPLTPVSLTIQVSQGDSSDNRSKE